MKNKNLSYYAYAFSHLRRDSKKGGAPHKPILLLSLIDAFDKGFYQDNKIYIIPELIGFFKANWSKYVKTEHDLRFALPFYHMQTEGFWHLIPNAGCELWVQSKGVMRGLSNLETAVEYAEIDIELSILMQDVANRNFFRSIILEKYFKNSSIVSNSEEGLKIIEEIRNQIVDEDKAEYLSTIKKLKLKLDKEAFEEEIILRGSIFKREVPKNYNYTCCFSKLRIEVPFNLTNLIQACHIEPFSLAYNDTLSNGIALTPTLHTAFDRGLITISDNYEIIVSNRISETESPQSIRRYQGKQILLPLNERHYPSLESIFWHRKNRFEK